MGKTAIEIYTFLSRNSADYADIFRTSCEALKSGTHTIKYKCIRTIGNPQMPEAERIPDGWEHMADIEVNNASNSYCHADGMHKAIELLSDTFVKDIIFVDADTVILYQDWDKVITTELNKFDIFGWAKTSYPSVFFFAFRRDILSNISMDFFPVVGENGETPIKKQIKTEKESKEFGIPIWGSVKCDTGWRIPQLAYRASLRVNATMKRVYGKDRRRQLTMPEEYKDIYKSNPEHMAEYHWNGQIYGSHRQASRNCPMDSEQGKAWKARINEYLNRVYGWTI